MKKMCKFKERPAGMTLVELATVVSILGILALIGVPGIIGGIQRTGVDGASRRLAEDLRLAQATALTQGVQARLVAVQTDGTAPNSGWSDPESTKANMYRIETRSSATATWPSPTADPGGDSNVQTVWNTLSKDYKGISIASGNTVVFNSQGFLANSTSALDITLNGPGGTRTVRTSVIGRATFQ
jgi:prepilin-type N-terminal cleavage/methylation domain-containing protein